MHYCTVTTMLGTKLLLILVPLLLVEAQNRRYGTVNRLPFRRPVVRPRPTTTLPPPTTISIITDESPSYLPEKDNNYVADTSNVLSSPKIIPKDSNSKEPLTIVYPENYYPLPSSPRPTYLPNRRPNPWHRPINAPPTSSIHNQLIPRFPPYMNTKPAETAEETVYEILPTTQPPPAPTTQPPPPPTTQPPPPPTTQPPPPSTTQPPPPPTTQPPSPPTTQPPPSPPTTQPPPPTPKPKPVHIWQPEIDDSLYPNTDYVESSAADETGVAFQPDYSDSSYPAWQPPQSPTYTPPAITETHIKPIQSRPTTSKPLTRPPRPITSKPITRPSRPATAKPITRPVSPPMQWPVTKRKPLNYDINQLQDYVCKQRDGYEPVANKCDVYIQCKRNIAYQNICPDGLHFNAAVRYPEYPCSYPSEVQCESADEIQEPQPSGQCPHRYGFYALPSSDCSQYMRCQEGLPTIMSCPAGLAFDAASSSCDWPANVPGCNPDVFQGFTCPAPEADSESRIVSKYRYRNSCIKYIACYRGFPRLLSCDSGTFFDPESGSCIDEDQVHDCED